MVQRENDIYLKNHEPTSEQLQAFVGARLGKKSLQAIDLGLV